MSCEFCGSAYDDGYAAGVQAARDAVMTIPDMQPTTAPGWLRRDDALTAIDALRGTDD